MARYIDADKVLAEFPIRRDHYDEENGSILFINGIETVMEYIDTIADEQPADVAPVIHAHWITDFSSTRLLCSNCNCGRRHQASLHGTYEHLPPFPKYCENCNAKMDEEVDEG